MPKVRLPRFKRTPVIASLKLTKRDLEIVRLVHRHRFLRSTHITSLLRGSCQQLLRRLQLLYHHGYLERPRAQLEYYHRSGSSPIVYGLGSKGVKIVRPLPGKAKVRWGEKNRSVGRMFLEHALLVSDTLIALDLACRANGKVRL